MKWIIILMMLMLPMVLAESDIVSYEIGEVVDLSVHISADTTNCLTGATPYVLVWDSSWNVVIEDSMNELDYCWYNYSYIANQTGEFHGFVNLTYNGVNATSTVDFEVARKDDMLAIVFGSFVVILFFIFLGYLNQSPTLKFTSYGVSLIQLILMLGLIYAYESGMDYVPLLRINFITMMLIGLGIGFLSLIMRSFTFMNLAEPQTEDNPYKKWR